jgi:hypothetical protein
METESGVKQISGDKSFFCEPPESAVKIWLDLRHNQIAEMSDDEQLLYNGLTKLFVISFCIITESEQKNDQRELLDMILNSLQLRK